MIIKPPYMYNFPNTLRVCTCQSAFLLSHSDTKPVFIFKQILHIKEFDGPQPVANDLLQFK